MRTRRTLCRPAPMVAVLTFVAAVMCPAHGAAQGAITADGKLGTAVSRSGRAYTITGGTVSGLNLFHSFGRFNVPTGGSATFTGPGSIQNVIGRVTGGERSTIDGLISSRASMPTANFFLINPSGVVFTAGARTDVGGAFHVSTADYIRLADDTIFSATPAAGVAPVLTSAAPQAFGFVRDAPAPIAVTGAFLLMPSGQRLSLVGGDVRVTSDALLLAPSGRVEIGSVASPGEVVLRTSGPDLQSFSRLGRVSITDGAFLAANGSTSTSGGLIRIRSGRLIVDGATLTVNTIHADALSKGIDLQATESITLRNSATVLTESRGLGDAGGISIVTDRLTMADGASVSSETIGSGVGRTGDVVVDVGRADVVNGKIRTIGGDNNIEGAGNITVSASGTLMVAGAGAEISTATATSDPDAFAGNISVAARDVILRDGAIIRNGDRLVTGGQSMSITAKDSLVISGLAGIASYTIRANGGTLDISATRLVMDNGFINASTVSAADAGRVSVAIGTGSLTNGAQIASSSQIVSSGAASSVHITATDALSISGTGDVGGVTFTGSPSSGLFSTAQGSGAAGEITVNTPRLTLGDQAVVSVQTSGTPTAVGGRILLNAEEVNLSGRARVDSGTTGAARGGNIDVRGDRITLEGDGTGFFSNAESAGAGGTLTVTGREVTVHRGARMSATSSGTGNAGNIDVTIGDTLRLNRGLITTTATAADGGDISIVTTGSLLHLTDSQITTSVGTGDGAGGNITIGATAHPVDFVVLNDSQIRADAHGGPGGNVDIVADVFLTSGSILSASSALGVPGTINVQASITDVSGSIAQLPETVLQAAALLRASCAARLAGGKTSSLVVSGREAVPPEPGSLLPSPLALEGLADASRTHDEEQPRGEAFRGLSRSLVWRDCAR